MLDFEDIKYEISDFAHEKPVLLSVIILVVFLFIAGLVILMIQTTPAKKTEFQAAEPFTQDSPILIPDSPDIEKDYYPSRVTENQWGEDEVKKWFTFPEDEVMGELEKANNSIITDVIEAAP